VVSGCIIITGIIINTWPSPVKPIIHSS
jgi:hypothetical protein